MREGYFFWIPDGSLQAGATVHIEDADEAMFPDGCASVEPDGPEPEELVGNTAYHGSGS